MKTPPVYGDVLFYCLLRVSPGSNNRTDKPPCQAEASPRMWPRPGQYGHDDRKVTAITSATVHTLTSFPFKLCGRRSNCETSEQIKRTEHLLRSFFILFVEGLFQHIANGFCHRSKAQIVCVGAVYRAVVAGHFHQGRAV